MPISFLNEADGLAFGPIPVRTYLEHLGELATDLLGLSAVVPDKLPTREDT
jgi:hypothetical protein